MLITFLTAESGFQRLWSFTVARLSQLFTQFELMEEKAGSPAPETRDLYLRAGQCAPKVLNLPPKQCRQLEIKCENTQPYGGRSILKSYRLVAMRYTAAGRAPLPPRRVQSHSGLSGVDAVWILPRTKVSLFLLKDSGPQSHWQVTEVLKTLLTLTIYWVLLAPGKPQMALIPSLLHPFVDLSDAP